MVDTDLFAFFFAFSSFAAPWLQTFSDYRRFGHLTDIVSSIFLLL